MEGAVETAALESEKMETTGIGAFKAEVDAALDGNVDGKDLPKEVAEDFIVAMGTWRWTRSYSLACAEVERRRAAEETRVTAWCHAPSRLHAIMTARCSRACTPIPPRSWVRR